LLLDTNILSELSKPNPDEGVEQWVSELEDICISGMTLVEIRYGLLLKKNVYKEKWFERIFPALTVLEAWPGVFSEAFEMLDRSKKNGVTIDPGDAVIAAYAGFYGMTLATRNTKDFKGCGINLFNPFQTSS
jgi:hypothetical protein